MIEPAAIEPDVKDWTWVLQRPCPECGFDARAVSCHDVPSLLRAVAERLAGAVENTDEPRRRPRPDRWSPLEYACHVRDVFRLFDRRLVLMLNEDDPLFANWNQDETAVAERYWEQDPRTVVHELREAGNALAARFSGVSSDEWQRPGRRSDGATFTVETFGRYLAHDPVHHLFDVTGKDQAGFP